jgi:cytochrome P450
MNMLLHFLIASLQLSVYVCVQSVQLDLASKHQDSPLTLQHLNTMDYAYKAVKESLRMATIVSWFPRVALKDCQVAGN